MKDNSLVHKDPAGLPGSTVPQQRCPGRNYFTKHWQGEYTLATSYWLNYIVAGIFFLLLLHIYPQELITSTIHDLYIYIAIYCIALTVMIWQVVGVWRAADNHIRKTKRRLWANTVKILMILGLMSTGCKAPDLLPGFNKFITLFSRDTAVSDYSIRVMANHEEVELAGGIQFGLTKVLRTVFSMYPTIKVIHLNSYGGRVVEARLLREFIVEKKLVTSTDKGCLSACTIAYMGGISRLVHGEKKLGFHRYGLADKKTEFIKKAVVESFQEDKIFFLNKGTSQSFMNQIYNTSPAELWFPDNDVLFANKIITGIAKDTDFILYQEAPSDMFGSQKRVSGDSRLYPESASEGRYKNI